MRAKAQIWIQAHAAVPGAAPVLGPYGFVMSLTGFQEAWTLAFSTEAIAFV
jgi:hypothetical protein